MNFQDIEKKEKRKKIARISIVGFLIIGLGFMLFFLKIIMEDYFFWLQTKDMYIQMAANYPIDYSFLKPFKNWGAEDLSINADGAILVQFDGESSKVLFEKNSERTFPIASLTKVFSAYVAIKSYDFNDEIKFSQAAVETEENIGFFKLGEKFFLGDLLYSVLMESSNDASYAIAEKSGVKTFVASLNNLSKDLGLEKTWFVDPIGLDPDYAHEKYNQASAKDIARFLEFLILESDKDPKIKNIFDITKTQEFDLYTSDGIFHHKIKNTNKIIDDFSGLFIAGKTGTSPMAKECFVTISKHQKNNNNYIISVVLGSKNRFEDTKKIIEWINGAYIW